MAIGPNNVKLVNSMTRKTRRFIFYIFLFFFIIFASIIILYAQGYSFDWQKKSPIITGAFYLKSYPKDADIYIDNEYKGKTNRYIKRLFPEEYDIRISKPNYYSWQKTLEINPKLVTEAKNILLVKKDPLINQITDYNVKHFSFSNDKKKIIYLTDKAIKEIDPTKQQVADPGKIITYSQFALRLIDLDRGTDNQIYPGFLVKGVGFLSSLPDLKNLLEISWSNDNEKVLLSFINNSYYVLDFKNQLKIIDINNLVKVLSNYKIYNIENLLFHSYNSDKIYFYSKNNLYSIELNYSNPYESLLTPSPIISDILVYTISNNNILYIKYPDGDFYETNLDISSFKKIFDIPLLKPNQAIEIINDEMFIIDSTFYFFNPQTRTLEKIAIGVREFQFSHDNEKLFWRTKNEIGVIWLKPTFGQPLRKKYETEIVMKAFEEINQAVWCSKTNEHIIFVLEDNIKITELDGRDKRNTMNLILIENPKVFYNQWNENLYILSKERLFEINLDS